MSYFILSYRKVYVFFENLFHGVAVYSGVALIGRLEGKLYLEPDFLNFNPIPAGFLALIDCLKIPAQYRNQREGMLEGSFW